MKNQKQKNWILLLTFWGILLWGSPLYSQVGIGTTTPNASTELDINSTSKGVLFPRLTNAQMTAISSPATGLQIFNTDANCMYYFNGTNWLSTLNFIGAKVNAGIAVQLDNIKARVPSSGNRSLEIATVSGTISVSGTSYYHYLLNFVGGGGGGASYATLNLNSFSFNTTFKPINSGSNFPQHGSVQRMFLFDETNQKAYKIVWIVGASYNNNTIEIERLY